MRLEFKCVLSSFPILYNLSSSRPYIHKHQSAYYNTAQFLLLGYEKEKNDDLD